ncbi:thiamine pyrophosphate-dependent enzyme [Bradyrhizobium sp. LMTR 3]|uniref:thiamine pyrophosphate-dependent enzyme n=1 Tax=Bradyrhizobium sp. LMTR 3 TaxID=189873 RepID=UPI001AECDEDA|nr:thiamine pyrophosphate-dependent enzyme [Bradyrhizobium sp. LMTR 3]
MYHLPELVTARRHGLNTITVVNNNHCLALGRRIIDAAYEGRSGNKEEMFAYREIDFARIAGHGLFWRTGGRPRGSSRCLRKGARVGLADRRRCCHGSIGFGAAALEWRGLV